MIGMGVSDIGVTASAVIAKLAAVAIAVIETKAAYDMAKMQEKIAKGELRIAQEQNDYYYETYAPCELAELEEACSAVMYDAEEFKNSSRGRMSLVAKIKHSADLHKAISCTGRYCTGNLKSLVRDAVIAEGAAVTATGNMGIRYEEKRKEAKDDLRRGRRSQALARGRDMMSQALSYSGFAFGLFGDLGQQAGAAAAGAVGYLAYSANRRETEYPQRVQHSVDRTAYVSAPTLPIPTYQPEQAPRSIRG